MILKPSQSVARQPMTMPGAVHVEMQLLCGPADGCPNFAMRKFTVAPGGMTPRHTHDYEHEVYIVAGCGVACSPQGEHPIQAGDALFVPAGELHQFRNTGDAPLQFICMVPAGVHRPVDCAAGPTRA